MFPAPFAAALVLPPVPVVPAGGPVSNEAIAAYAAREHLILYNSEHTGAVAVANSTLDTHRAIHARLLADGNPPASGAGKQ